MGLSSFNFFSRGLRKTFFRKKIRIRFAVCDFLLVRHSNLGPPILHHFGDIAGFCAHDSTPLPPVFWGVPVGPDRRCWGQPSIYLKA